MQLKPNALLQGGKYKIERVLGQGGFGITYQAVQVALNRKVAIKEFFMKEYCERNETTSQVSLGTSGSRETVERFRQKFIKEAQNIAALNHPHIIRIYDVFEENGTAYYVMEYIEGLSLSQMLNNGKVLTEEKAFYYTRQVAEALKYVHGHNRLHLDVNPKNIMVDRADRAILIDFGLSKQYDERGCQMDSMPVGLRHGYSPLEQYKGVAFFSPATDIYALGATFYKLLTGQTPPEPQDVLTDGFPTLSYSVSDVAVSVIKKAMQPARKNRPQNIDSFLCLLSDNKPKGQSVHDVHEEDGQENTNIEVVGFERKYFNVLPSGTVLHGHSYTYEIVKVLGQGTFGISYLANVRLSGALGELQSAVQVAIKEFFMKDLNGRQGNTVTSGSDSDIYRNYRNDFMREANNLAKLKHPHIVKVLEAFESNNTCYFSMEYINGGNLNEYIQQCKSLSEREALQGIVEVGEALAFMHNNNMLHLDLKPLNVMRRKDGGLVLIDFGLSKQFDRNGEPESSTRIGGGTIGYAPLEQANYKKGEGFPATLDIYALGATLFKMLTGNTPTDASTIFNDGFPEDELRGCGISDEVILLVSWAMEPMKRKRPQTVKEFLDEAKRLLPGSSDTQNVKVESRESQRQQTRSVVKGAERCNGFTVNWKPGLKDSQKDAIRHLLGSMRKVGECKVYHNNDVAVHPIMSICDWITHGLYDEILDAGGTDWYFRPMHLTISEAIRFLLKLQQYTGLPFRFSRGEYRDEHSAPEEHWRDNPSLWYLPEKGFIYISTGVWNIQSYKDFFSRTYCLEIVCDRMSPVIVDGRFDVQWTQIIYNQLEPIGFGFYKGELNNRWSVVSENNTLSSLLPQEYDDVSCIDLYTIPGGGPLSYSKFFLGIMTYLGDRIACYELKNGRFCLLTEMSKKEWDKRRLWT